jgi:hypothetical protein
MMVGMEQVTGAHSGISRRTALKAFGAGIGTAALLPWLSDEGLAAFAGIQAANAVPAPKVLTPPQFTTLETLVEAIIPADERSPGAKQARVADYIDLLLSESERERVLEWFGGLAALDAEATRRFKVPFNALNPDQLDAILADISRNEREPQTALELFFAVAKQATVQGYYTSEIGVHQELHYKGNKFLKEFVGCETEDGRDCQYCGQKRV